MRIQDALREIAGLAEGPQGWIVVFTRPVGGKRDKGRIFVIQQDQFPDVDAGEKPIRTEEEAWALAEAFAAKTVGWTRDVMAVPHPFPIGGYSGEARERAFNKGWGQEPSPSFES